MLLDANQHTALLLSILKAIYADKTLGPYLAFKGGTAAMLFYELSRFSVDLDFDLLDAAQEDYIFNRLKTVLQAYGTIKEAHKKRYNLFFLLSYHNKLKDAQNIKVEINTRNFGSHYAFKTYMGLLMQVMVPEDMAAHKLVAMYERMGRANRDIYDVWYFLHNNWPINTTIIEQRTKMTYKQFLKQCIAALENLSNQHILAGMGELLNAKQKVWVKSKLKADTIFLLKLALRS